jgi:hypothetical protein
MHIGEKGKEINKLFPFFSCQVVVPGEVLTLNWRIRFFRLARNDNQKLGFDERVLKLQDLER